MTLHIETANALLAQTAFYISQKSNGNYSVWTRDPITRNTTRAVKGQFETVAEAFAAARAL